jgi:hypothetical protein
MRKSVFSIFLFSLLFTFSLEILAQSKDSIVVWRIEPKTGVSDKEADTISGIVTAEVGRVSGKKTVGENEMKALLVGEEMKLQCGAEDSACVAEIGAALGAPESITGTISKMGKYWILTLQRLNVRNVEVISRYEKKIKGDVNLLIESISPAVKHLFGIKEEIKEAVAQKTNDPNEVETAPEKTETPMKKPKKLRKLGKIGIGLIGGGAAVLIFGGIAHWKTGVEKKNYEDGKTGGDPTDYNTWKAVSITSYTVGALVVGTGAALLIADLIMDSPVKTAVIPTKGGAYITAVWRF